MRGRFFMLGLVLCAVPLVAVTATNTDSTADTDADAVEVQGSEQQATVESGLRVYIDPKTGERRTTPTEEQREMMRRQAERDRIEGRKPRDPFSDPDAFTTEVMPSGAIMLRTHGKHQSVVMARPGTDGKPVIECTDATHGHTAGDHSEKRGSATRDER